MTPWLGYTRALDEAEKKHGNRRWLAIVSLDIPMAMDGQVGAVLVGAWVRHSKL